MATVCQFAAASSAPRFSRCFRSKRFHYSVYPVNHGDLHPARRARRRAGRAGRRPRRLGARRDIGSASPTRRRCARGSRAAAAAGGQRRHVGRNDGTGGCRSRHDSRGRRAIRPRAGGCSTRSKPPSPPRTWPHRPHHLRRGCRAARVGRPRLRSAPLARARARRRSSSRQARWVRVSCGSSRSSIAPAPAIPGLPGGPSSPSRRSVTNRSRPASRDAFAVLDLDRAGSPARRHRRLRTTTERFGLVHIRHSGAGRQPLVDAEVSSADLAAARDRWKRNSWGALIFVLGITLLACAAPIVERRRVLATRAALTAASLQLAAILLGALAVAPRGSTAWTGSMSLAAPPSLLVTSLVAAALGWLALDFVERRRTCRPRPSARDGSRRDTGHRGVVCRGGHHRDWPRSLRACCCGRSSPIPRSTCCTSRSTRSAPAACPSRLRSCCSTPRSSGPPSPSSAPPPRRTPRLAPSRTGVAGHDRRRDRRRCRDRRGGPTRFR